jgi:hypothetical protein
MYCPKCKTEYRDGFYTCSDCGSSLVPELPEETPVPDIPSYSPHYKEVLRTTNLPFLAVLRTALDNEGIIYFVHGENFSTLYSQPARLMILEEDAGKVEKIIREMDSGLGSKIRESPIDEFEYDPEYNEGIEGDSGVTRQGSSFIVGLILGLALGSVVGLFLYTVYHRGSEFLDRTIRIDRNRDGKTDEWAYYENGKLKRAEADDNFDGKCDSFWTYSNETMIHSSHDTDFNGIVDEICFYRYGVQERCEIRPNGSKVMVKKQIFKDGVLQEEFVDKDKDGKFDERIVYDFIGNPVKTIKLPENAGQ